MYESDNTTSSRRQMTPAQKKLQQDLDEFYRGPVVKAEVGLQGVPEISAYSPKTMTISVDDYSNLIKIIAELTEINTVYAKKLLGES